LKQFESLERLPSTPEEKAWLQERMETLSVRESMILSGALMSGEVHNGCDLVNVFQAMQDYEVCYPAGSYAQLGRFYLAHETQLPENIPDFIDTEQLGKNYEDEHPGIFFGNCYVEYPNQGPALRYDGTNLAACVDDGWSVKVKLASERCPDGVWLRLPDYGDANDGKPDETRITLDELGVKTVDECTLLDAQCILPEIGNLMEQYDRISDLVYDGQNLGFVLDERGQGMENFTELYAGALQYEDCASLAEALDIAENLNRYDFVPMRDLREYARKELNNRGIELPPLAAGVFQYEEYAAQCLQENGFVLNTAENAYIGKTQSQRFADMFMQ
jgi:hypothetical protein